MKNILLSNNEFLKANKFSLYIAYKTFLAKEFYNFNTNSKKRNSIFMKGNADFLNAHLKNISKCCVRSCRQLVKTLIQVVKFNTLKMIFVLAIN